MYSPFQPPTNRDAHRILALAQRVRCFDFNDGKSFALPNTDPHGNPWTLLSADELEARRHWCMLPEMHKALAAEMDRRAGLPYYYSGVR